MREIETEGKNVEEAIDKGLKELKLPRENVEIKILDEGASGLFGLMGAKPARVQMWVKETTEKEVGETLQVTETGSKEPGVEVEEVSQKAKEILSKILTLAEIEATIKIELAGDKILLAMDSENSALLIGKKGATLDALELLTNLILAREYKINFKVVVDIEDYRIRQEKKLVDAAYDAANEVKQYGKEYQFEPMSARDRKTIHSALQDDPDVVTISEGEGYERHLIIRPRNK